MSHANIPCHCFCPLTHITPIIVVAKQQRNKKKSQHTCLYGLFYHEEPLDAVQHASQIDERSKKAFIPRLLALRAGAP